MDPISVLSIVGTCVSLSAKLVSIGKDIHTIQEAWAGTDDSLQALLVEVNTLSVAVKKISRWLQGPKADSLFADERSCLADSLATCESGLGKLQDHISNVKKDSGKTSTKGKFRHWWDHGDVDKYQALLGRQVQALSFLLQVLQLPDEQKRRSKLSERGSLIILERINDELDAATESGAAGGQHGDSDAAGGKTGLGMSENPLLDDTSIFDQASAGDEPSANSHDLHAPSGDDLGYREWSPKSPPTSTTATTAHTPHVEVGTVNPQLEIFKTFTVSIEDSSRVVLPHALKRYNIDDDWHQYRLFIVYGDQERCVGLDEKPLLIFRQLKKEGRKPVFMLRRAKNVPNTVGKGVAEPESQRHWPDSPPPSFMVNGIADKDMGPVLRRCAICDQVLQELSFCSTCEAAFCDHCWRQQLSHKRSRSGSLLLHRKQRLVSPSTSPQVGGVLGGVL
ncbi:hypothetical protein LTR86_010357 [Recurvomyces mirabilis]|nr:hypothetical protein LTR86_010357 [Recurvomyces mirabilis]